MGTTRRRIASRSIFSRWSCKISGAIRPLEKYNVVTRSSETQVEAGYKENVIGFGWTNGVFRTTAWLASGAGGPFGYRVVGGNWCLGLGLRQLLQLLGPCVFAFGFLVFAGLSVRFVQQLVSVLFASFVSP